MQKQRLELTWIGKNNLPTLEPRILIEDPEKSFGSSEADNILIHGDNLLALKALERDYSDKIKCIFIDPPYNTGQMFEHYDDGLEHSLWLTQMRNRILILHNLLKDNGFLWITVDDNEAHYLKVLCDEIFGRVNFIGNAIWEKSDSPRMDAIFFSYRHDHLLVYSKNKETASFNRFESIQEHYNKIDNKGRRYYTKPLRAMGGQGDSRKTRPTLYYSLVAPDGSKVYPKKQDGSDGAWRWQKEKVKKENDRIEWIKGKKGWTPYYRVYAESSKGRPAETIFLHQVVGSNRTSKAEIKTLFPDLPPFSTPKPEGLLKHIIHISTSQEDLVLDSFLGSGTTAAVAQKMGRRWIGIELGEHCYTHCKPRLDKVITGEDQGGISKTVNWKGGGGYKFYELAPSLLNRDTYGNWVINKQYNADMLAAAMAKQEGFKYDPNPDVYWKHGQSTEQDYIFTTTEFLTQEHVEYIHGQMKEGESLLICCKAFSANDSRYSNITIKKIPQMLMGKCEFGKDDYSLNIINIPTENDGYTEEDDISDSAPEQKAKYIAGQGELFDMEGDNE